MNDYPKWHAEIGMYCYPTRCYEPLPDGYWVMILLAVGVGALVGLIIILSTRH